MNAEPEKSPEQIRKILQNIFNRASRSDMPAMSAHVQELIRLTNSSKATANQLTDAILKDYSLTNKILQVANSAHYNRGVSVRSISRAVTVIGFDTVKELAMAISLFEEFMHSGENKAELFRLLTMSFLAAMQVKILAKSNRLNIPMEDAFICGLLHNLGNIAVLVFLPELYCKIIALLKKGKSEKMAAKMVLDDLTLNQVGQEMARHWNFSDHIIATMDAEPFRPKNQGDGVAYLHNLVVYCNGITTAICRGHHFHSLLDEYGKLFSLDRLEAVSYVEKSVAASEDTSPPIRKGLELLNIHSRLKTARRPDSASTMQ